MQTQETAKNVNIGIDDSSRAKIADGLSHLLADTYTLYLKTHNFHSHCQRTNVSNFASHV